MSYKRSRLFGLTSILAFSPAGWWIYIGLAVALPQEVGPQIGFGLWGLVAGFALGYAYCEGRIHENEDD